jgi:hypothetical protein
MTPFARVEGGRLWYPATEPLLDGIEGAEAADPDSGSR